MDRIKIEIEYPKVSVESDGDTTFLLAGVEHSIGRIYEDLKKRDPAEAEYFKKKLQKDIADDEQAYWHYAERHIDGGPGGWK